MVHGNNENSLIKLINFRTNASYYEIPAVRNIKVEMANQDNPVAVASFEVMNPLKHFIRSKRGQKLKKLCHRFIFIGERRGTNYHFRHVENQGW